VRQHGDQGVLATGAVAGVGDLGQDREQGSGFGLCHRCRIRKQATADGKTVITGSYDRTARLWDVAAELPDDLERVANWVEALAGLTLDDSGSIQVLDNAALRQRREKVKQQGGPPVADAAR
jgi:hypothetical protein